MNEKKRTFPKETPRQQSAAKKVWNFLWNSDSLLSWIVDLILLYIFVKFIFFPALSFALATPLPSVIVQTSSMTHNGKEFDAWWDEFGSWYESQNITEAQALQWEFHNGFDKGDIMILKGERNNDYSRLEVGDSIVFQANQPVPIIHRIISIHQDGTVSTKGDNNHGQLEIEKIITPDRIIGKAVARIPKLGWIKLWPLELLHASP